MDWLEKLLQQEVEREYAKYRRSLMYQEMSAEGVVDLSILRLDAELND